MSDYKPTEHDGLRKDGKPDGRVSQSADSTSYNSERDSTSPDNQSSSNQTEEIYKPSEHDGSKKDGTPDKRVSSEHGFGSRPHEEVVAAAKTQNKGDETFDEEYNA